MKKRISCILAALTALAAGATVWAAPLVSIEDITYDGVKMYIDGSLRTEEEINVTMLITRKTDSDEILSAGEIKSSGGEISFTVKMPDTVSDYYLIRLQADGGNIDEEEFYYVSRTARENFLEGLRQSPDTFGEKLKEGNNYYIWKSAGFEIDGYNSLSQQDRQEADLILSGKDISGMDGGEIKEFFNKTIYLIKYNGSKTREEADGFFEKMNFDWEDFPQTDEKREEILYREMYKTKPYENTDEMYNRACTVIGAYVLENTRTAGMTAALDRYSRMLGYDTDSVYKAYLDADNKTNINQKFVNNLYKNNDYTVGGLMKQLKDAMNGSTGSSDGGSHGGSSGGSNPGGGDSKGNTGSSAGSGVVQRPEQHEEKEDDKIFSDLSDASWAEESILALYEKGIISGYEDKTVRPNNMVTREEFVTMLIKALGINTDGAYASFKDVGGDMWYYPFVAAAYANKIVSGISEEEFGIGRNITRQDMALMSYNAAGGRVDAEEYLNGFDDWEDISDYAKDSVAILHGNGIVSGRDGRNFAPREFCTRAEASVIIYKLFVK